MTKINIGDQAPDFELPADDGTTIRLSDYRDKQAVVLYFYPKDETPGCTKEACTFRDAYQDFVDAGAEVIGVSSDSADSHQKFRSHHKLQFKLAVDTGGQLRRSFGIPKTLGLLPGRETYVIDREGVVRLVFNSQFAATRHVAEALQTLRGL